MRIAVGSDHAGYEVKERVAARLRAAGHEVTDCGCHSADSCDYPEFGAAVGRAVSSGEAERGVLVCGTGIGISMAANKVPGVRAAVAHNRFTARASREHNDANVLCLGARVVEERHALELCDYWLTIEFGGGRHARRVAKIDALDHAET